MCQVVIESIKSCVHLSLLSINYQQHERKEGWGAALWFIRGGGWARWELRCLLATRLKSKQWNVESRSERQGTGTQVTTSSVSTQEKLIALVRPRCTLTPSPHTASPLSPPYKERKTLWIWVMLPSPPLLSSVLMSARSVHPGLGRDVERCRRRSRPGKCTLHCLSWMRGWENGEAQMQMFRHVLVF